MQDTLAIQGYHAHVYYADPSERRRADELRQEIARTFAVRIGRSHDIPVGPHPQPMFQVSFAVAQFAELVPWLMFRRDGLNILIHPVTGDDVSDHRDRALWLGRNLPLDIAFLEKLEARPSGG